MKNSSSSFACVAIVLLTSLLNLAVGQTQLRDVVYLKNGSIIKGVIIEQIPNKTIKVQTADGSIFVYDFSEIERIAKEPVSAPAGAQQLGFEEPTRRLKPAFAIMAGMAVPVGDFASTTSAEGGGAKIGFAGSAEFSLPVGDYIEWATAVTVSFNKLDEAAALQFIGESAGSPIPLSGEFGSWSTIWPMTGLRISTSVSPSVRLYGTGQIGMLFGSSPEVDISGSGSVSGGVLTLKVNAKSASASSFAYGFAVGILVGNNINIGTRYISGKPKYTATASGTGTYTGSGFSSLITLTSALDFEQSTSVIQVFVGVGF